MILGMPLLQFVMVVQVSNILISMALAVAGFYFRNAFTGRADFEAACARIATLETEKKIAEIAQKGLPSKEDVSALKLENLAIEATQAVLDERLKTLATKDDIGEVREALSNQDGLRRDLAGDVKGITSTVNAMKHTLDLISQSLMADRNK